MMSPDTLRIDRRFKGVGRIAKATGTNDPRTFAAIGRMLDTLYATGELELLRQLRDGVHTPLVLYDAYRRHALDTLPSAATAGGLVVAMQQWLAGLTDADAVAETRRGHGFAIQRIERVMPEATIHEAAEALNAVRAAYADTPRAFNLTRSTLQAFLRDTLTPAHPVYHQVAAVPTRRVPKSRRFHPLTPDEMRAQFPDPQHDPVDAIAWTMATTGMGPKELWVDGFAVRADRVHVGGVKRPGRTRDVPLVMRPAVPTLSRKAFEQRLKRRATTEARPYDFRRTYANWLEAAGIPRTRRIAYMGHASGNVTDLYERHDVTRYLTEDAEKIRGILGGSSMLCATVGLKLVGGADA